MKVFILTADTHNDYYGSEISLFGVFTTKQKAEQRKADLSKLGYHADVNETQLDKICEIYLGGYVEKRRL